MTDSLLKWRETKSETETETETKKNGRQIPQLKFKSSVITRTKKGTLLGMRDLSPYIVKVFFSTKARVDSDTLYTNYVQIAVDNFLAF
jgi:hypothetical protein